MGQRVLFEPSPCRLILSDLVTAPPADSNGTGSEMTPLWEGCTASQCSWSLRHPHLLWPPGSQWTRTHERPGGVCSPHTPDECADLWRTAVAQDWLKTDEIWEEVEPRAVGGWGGTCLVGGKKLEGERESMGPGTRMPEKGQATGSPHLDLPSQQALS